MLMQLVARCALAVALIGSLATTNVDAQPLTLRACLAALENAHQITILLHPSVQRGTQKAQCPNLADAEAALRSLLRGYDFFFQYAAASDASAVRLRRVWVFPRGDIESMRISPQEEHVPGSCDADFNLQLSDALARSVEEAVAVVTRALEDLDENVRQQALDAIQREALPVPDHLIEGVFLGDASDNIRAAALDVLVTRVVADGGDVTATVDRALQDPSPLVHDRALSLMESLGVDLPPGEPRPPVKPGGRD